MPRFFSERTKRIQRVRRALGRSRMTRARPVAFNRVQRRSNLRNIPPELKFFDTAVSFTPDGTVEVPATGQWALIPQGDTSSTRDGRLAVIKSIQFRGGLTGPIAAEALTMPIWYLWVIHDRQANGAAAAAADVFVGAAAFSCLVNLNNSKRFSILHKERIAPNTVGLVETAASTNTMSWPIEFYKKVNISMNWSGTTGAITEITQDNIFIVCGVSAGAATPDDNYNISGNARLRFVG